jgi:ATP-dependent RNA helicase RhlE
MSFNALGLSAELLRAVAEEGYRVPTPIQRQVIPAILEGRDIMAGAQTGTGKTAGFALPLLHRLSARADGASRGVIRTLILTPTRELAAQVEESVRTYGKYLPLKSAVIFGGVKINPQIAQLRRGMDILVATPGRLLDHVGQRTLDLSRVEILVLDEADRMLDMGFIRDIRRILALLPRRRQNLLFSATFSDEIKHLAADLLDSPTLIQAAAHNAAAELVSHVMHPVDRTRKRALLSFLITSGNWKQVLVFTRTKHIANRLAEQLQRDGIRAAAIHGNKSQAARTRALADFKRGEIRILVATDIAARGLDIEQLPHVVNFELPNVAEHYVHRIGRTGRAGQPGDAVSLVCVDENGLLKDIERLLGHAIPKVVIPGYEPDRALKAEPIRDRRVASRDAKGRGGHDSGNRRRGRASPSNTIPSGRGREPHAASGANAQRTRRNTGGAEVGGRAPASRGEIRREPTRRQAPSKRRSVRPRPDREIPALLGGGGNSFDLD